MPRGLSEAGGLSPLGEKSIHSDNPTNSCQVNSRSDSMHSWEIGNIIKQWGIETENRNAHAKKPFTAKSGMGGQSRELELNINSVRELNTSE